MPGSRSALAGFILALSLSMLPALLRAEDQPLLKTWPPVTGEELALKDDPARPGAPAVILYQEDDRNDATGIRFVFKRIKILTAAGADYGNIEVEYEQHAQAIGIFEARVIGPDGKVREFKGQIMEKTALKARGFKLAVKSIALPDVSPGCIVDYRYTRKLTGDMARMSASTRRALAELMSGNTGPEEGGEPDRSSIMCIRAEHWDIQDDDLFIRKARFVYVESTVWDFLSTIKPMGLAAISNGPLKTAPVIKGNQVTLEVENVPAFNPEDLMPPGDSQRMVVDLFYCDLKLKSFSNYWEAEGKGWHDHAEHFMGKPAKLQQAAAEIVGGTADRTEALRRIYDKVQSLRNLSYEEGLNEQTKKEQKLKDNDRVADVLAHGYGLRSDITRTFVALARAAGFEAQVVRIADRDDKFFRLNLPLFYTQFDSEAAQVEIDGRPKLLDPATPHCPFGLTFWPRSNTVGATFKDDKFSFMTTPNFPADKALTRRELALSLTPENDLAGTIKVTYQGQEALVRRLSLMHDDQIAVKKGLEDELGSLLPEGSSAVLKKVDGLGDNGQDLVAGYEVKIPGLVTEAGDKVLVPASLLGGAAGRVFSHAERRYPVYFPYQFRTFNDIVINVPKGLMVESLPAAWKTSTDFSAFSFTAAAEEPGRVHIQRDMTVSRSLFPVEQYGALKAFFDQVRSKDEEQIILVRGGK